MSNRKIVNLLEVEDVVAGRLEGWMGFTRGELESRDLGVSPSPDADD